MDKIVLVETIGVGTVYGIEVDNEDHSYYDCDLLHHNSTQLRQDINADLDLEDVRLSIDSSDAPHLHWVHGLVDGNITSYYNPKLETEIDEAEHDMKRRRIVKRKGSTDDLFQSCVGAYWLSDTVSAYEGDLKSIYGEKVNLVGARSYDRMLRNLGYK